MRLLLILLAVSSIAEGADLARPIILDGPRTTAPLPVDGAGTWRIVLDQAWQGSAITLVLEVAEGKVVDGFGLCLDRNPGWMPLRTSGMSATGAGIVGTAVLTVPGIPNLHPERERRKAMNPEVLPDLGEVQLDLSGELVAGEARGTGRWSLAWRGGRAGVNGLPVNESGIATIWRAAPPAERPAACELVAAWGFGDAVLAARDLSLRARLAEDGSAVQMAAHHIRENPHDPVAPMEPVGQLRLAGGKVAGRIDFPYRAVGEGGATASIRWDIEGRAIGRHLVADIAVASGTGRWRTRAIGRWMGGEPDLPLLPQSATLPAPTMAAATDPALATEAATEAAAALFPGEPDQRSFWSWRWVVLGNGRFAALHPPSFDLRAVPGAASYRVTMTPKDGGKPFIIRLERPWQPWTPSWRDIPAGTYKTTVSALDAAGMPLPDPICMGILDKETGGPSTAPFGTLTLVKKAPFAGISPRPPRTPEDAALAAARWTVEGFSFPNCRALGDAWVGSARGEDAASWRLAGQIWAALGTRALSTAPGERAAADELLDWYTAGMAVNQRASAWCLPMGILYCYKGYIPLTRFGGHALLDIHRETGDPRCRELVLRMAEGLAASQQPSGTWWALDEKTRRPIRPGGVFTWKHAGGFGASELLYLLGRIRTELGTDRFQEIETKARAYVEREQVEPMFWPISVHHSMSLGYPIWQYPQATCDYIQYLLRFAPQPDVALAEQLGRWVEDRAITWDAPAKGGIAPVMAGGDRMQGRPADNALLAALAFLRLHEATGKRLWLAKADALVAAVLCAQSPATGQVHNDMGLHVVDDGKPYYLGDSFINGHVVRLLREYAALRRTIAGAR